MSDLGNMDLLNDSGELLALLKKLCRFSSFATLNYLKKMVSLGLALLITALLPHSGHFCLWRKSLL